MLENADQELTIDTIQEYVTLQQESAVGFKALQNALVNHFHYQWQSRVVRWMR
jgi:hypothetical protein